jgi:hypothetical protein
MTRQRTKRCETCQHWLKAVNPADGGRCHAPHLYAPLVRLSGIMPRLHTNAAFGCVCWITSDVVARISARDKGE